MTGRVARTSTGVAGRAHSEVNIAVRHPGMSVVKYFHAVASSLVLIR